MKRNRQLLPETILVIITGALLLLSACTTNEWHQFRGAGADMIVTGKNLPTEWNDSLNIRWTQAMNGESWSSPLVWGDKVFYSSAVLVDKAPLTESETSPSLSQDVYKWQLTCLDVKTGKNLWIAVAREGNPRTKKHAGSTYACETPVTDGKHVYVYFGMHGVYCYDLNGALVWEKDLGAYETQRGWGTGSSPVLYKQLLFVLVDNEESSFLVALDALTGEEKWKVARDEKTTYSTPVIWENNFRTELVTLGSLARSYNPENGDQIWELAFEKGRAVASPVFDKEKIYLGLSGGPRDIGTLYAVKAGAEGNISPAPGESTSKFVAWSDSLAGLCYPSPLLYNGLLYVLSDRGGEISCFDATSGKKLYKESAGKSAACWASPWIYNDRLYFYDEKGLTYVLKPGRTFEVLGTHSIDDKFWSSIAATNDAYIFKGVKNIYCVGK
ncbi:PQQ-binding-like beta-propeller repeat protein [Maribellus sp. CM-23]|uniref:outer membrane protein assembly factor BamB family protein n=1 Tax=Maribellus sp. CM-23 TaxID=2781026 RepID=UPI001F3CA9F2|nr:PQQ-binding-like beta-propeller repeat protein [Maribellus sp. CM-23]MCE4565318.1 PQQ-binding-like beta-propeller repeat protein [Maribellus sp. CM-23]